MPTPARISATVIAVVYRVRPSWRPSQSNTTAERWAGGFIISEMTFVSRTITLPGKLRRLSQPLAGRQIELDPA